ncbi:MAG: apolipoprotein N-acyltransferase [Saprospiraceae bacterium]
MSRQIKLTLIFLSLFVMLWSGWSMWSDYQNEILWGYWPLIGFVAGWTFVRLMLSIRWKKEDERWKWLGLSSLTGLILSLGFPPLPLTFLMFVGFVPLLLLENQLQGREKSVKTLLAFSYNAFVIWNILTTFWVANTAFIAGIAAIWINSFLMCIPFLLFHFGKKYMPGIAFILFAGLWISFEYIHLHWELSWSWLNLGNAFATFPTWIQWYEFLGVFGGSLWVLIINFMIFKLIIRIQSGDAVSFFEKVKPGLVFLIPIMISLGMYFSYEEQGRPTEVVVVQPNFEPHYKKFNLPDSLQVRTAIKLAEPLITERTRYVLLPETAFGLVEIHKFNEDYNVKMLRDLVRRHPNIKVVTGVDSYKILEDEEPSTRFTRFLPRRYGDTMRYEVYNGAIQLDSSAIGVVPHYQKSKLVPGPEIFPYRKLFFFLDPIIKKLGGSPSGLATQEKRTPLVSTAGKVAPVICYESVFGEYHTGYMKEGAEATFIMTNDGWWDNTPGHTQHLYFASLRAIETRKSIARSANSGTSAFINQRGDILQATKYDEPAAIRGDILMNDVSTFYITRGDLIAKLACFVSILFLLNLIVKYLMRKK